jgi:N6-adenosine-specific RNA methylase IME4
MTLLAAYDRARTALAEATQVGEVLAIRDELAHVKLYARQIQDRELLADATAIQLRAERRLGFLLAEAHKAGALAGKGRPAVGDDDERPATLKEIGVTPKLSAKAQKAAAIEENDFEDLVTSARDRIRSGKAIVIDPVVAAEKASDIQRRRDAHAERTKGGGCIEDLFALARSGRKFGSIGMDPQWKFIARSDAGDGRSANIHYKTEEVDKIKELPIEALAADDCALYMWMVDWCPQDALDLIAHYGFSHKTTAFTWVKTNGDGALDVWADSTWHFGQGYWTRANPEICLFATRGNPKRLYADVRQLIVAPVMEHSRKPDAWLERIERLTEGPYIELQARRPRAGWVSWGDELEFTGRAA